MKQLTTIVLSLVVTVVISVCVTKYILIRDNYYSMPEGYHPIAMRKDYDLNLLTINNPKSEYLFLAIVKKVVKK